MAKIQAVEGKAGEFINWVFYCPGCECDHGVWTIEANGNKAIWDWNGDVEKPTFNPSIRVTIPTPDKIKICHSFVKDGRIQFLSDCTHNLAGQTVELPDYETT